MRGHRLIGSQAALITSGLSARGWVGCASMADLAVASAS